jgi:hypothetical protein
MMVSAQCTNPAHGAVNETTLKYFGRHYQLSGQNSAKSEKKIEN